MKKQTAALFAAAVLVFALAACSAADSSGDSSLSGSSAVQSAEESTVDLEGLFTDRDLRQEADTSGAKTLQAASGKTDTISEEGVYILTGEAENYTVRIEAGKKAKVQLVLDGLNVTNQDFPVIYDVSAGKCFITTAAGGGTLSVTGTFRSDGSVKTDAVIFGRDDLVLNGTGTLSLTSKAGNGISGKDELRITGGTYQIDSALHSIEANDMIAVSGGTFSLHAGKDGLHTKNNDDDTLGSVIIKGGTFTIESDSDAVHAVTKFQMDAGSLQITAHEAIEATMIEINAGSLSIHASDDAFNAAHKSKIYDAPCITFNGGTTVIVMEDGDNDALDSNGDIIINGGTLDITTTGSAFDYAGSAQFNGGKILLNGTEISEIPESTK